MPIIINCDGYFSENYDDLERVKAVMDDIASITIERPEFELTDEESGISLHIAALFEEEGESMIGWLVAKHIENEPTHYAFCVSSDDSDEYIEDVVYCGAPMNILYSAVLSQEEVLEVVELFVRKSSEVEPFYLVDFKAIFGL